METFDAAVASIPPAAHLVRHLHLKSTLPRRDGDVTICTQCSLDRLERLEAQTNSWSGVICAAVMCPCPCRADSLRDAKQCVLALHARVEARSGPCRLDIILVSHQPKKFAGASPCQEPWRYPINALRNVALQSSATELVIVLDVDFLPGFGIQEQLWKLDVYSGYLRACTELRRVIILPALEELPDPEDSDPDSRPWEKNHLQSTFEIVSGSKAAVENLWTRGKLRTFAVDKYPRGHGPTDTDRWISSAATYEVQYEVDYEPYFLCSRRLVPWYDERFLGYGKNKVIHVFHTAVLDFRFWVHPEWYVIHVYHEHSRAWEATLGSDPLATNRLSDVKLLYAVAKHQLLSLRTHSGVHISPNPCACTAPNTSVPGNTWLPWKMGQDKPREEEPMGHWSHADQPSPLMLQTSTKKYIQALYDLRHHFCVPKLLPVAIHRSQLKPNLRDICLVTVATADRLPRLAAQCRRWKGVICAAVYAPPNSKVKDLERQLLELHLEVEKAGICRLDVVLMESAKVEKSKCIGRTAASSLDLCPINGLRNAALKLATTDLVLILDVDLLPAPSLNDCFLDEQQYKCLLRMAVEERTAVVVPSFEYADGNVGEYPASQPAKKSNSGLEMGKEKKSVEKQSTFQDASNISDTLEMTEKGVQAICKGLASGSLRGFHVNHYPAGHSPTDFEKWRELGESSNQGDRSCCEVCRSYNIKYAEGFEPFVFCSRRLIPNFDERFRGYGFDKVSFFYHLHQSGFGFRVLLHSFSLDVPHPKSQDWKKTFGPTLDPLQHSRVKALYQRAKREIRVVTGGSALANYVVEESPVHLKGKAKASAGLLTRSSKKFSTASLERHKKSTLEGLQLAWQGIIRRQAGHLNTSSEFHEEEQLSSIPTPCSEEEMSSMGSGISGLAQRDLAAKGISSCFGWNKSRAHGDASFAGRESKSLQSIDWVRMLEEFEWDSAGWKLKCSADSLSNCNVVKAPDPISEKEWFQPGGYWLRISMSAGSWSPQASRLVGITTGGVSVRSVLPIRAVKEVVVRYMVRFPSSFEWAKGGTLPGVWVDDVVQGNFAWRRDGEGHLSTALLGLTRKESEQHQPSLTKKASKLSRPFYFVPEQWHALQLIVSVVDQTRTSEHDRGSDGSDNQGSSSCHTLGIESIRDGAVIELRAFVDFELVSTINYPHREEGSPNVTRTGSDPGTSMGVLLSCYFGGKTQDWAAAEDTHIDFSQFEVWTD